MADTDIVQVIAEARVDARSLSEFVFKPAGFKVARRLAPTIDTLQFYIDRFNSLNGDFSSSVSVALSSLNNSVAEADDKVAYIETTVQDAINNTAVEGGVLADTFVTVTANGTGSVARTQRDKNADVISMKDFGAIGDGVTDDHAAIQSAVDFVISQGGGGIYVPAGEYLIGSTIEVAGDNVSFDGDGYASHFRTATDITAFVSSGFDNLSWSNIRITGTRTDNVYNGYGSGIIVSNANRVTVRRCFFERLMAKAVFYAGYHSAYGGNLEQGVHDGWAQDNYIDWCGDGVMVYNDGRRVEVSGNRISRCVNIGIYIDDSHQVLGQEVPRKSTRINVENNYIENMRGTTAINLAGTDYSAVRGNYILYGGQEVEKNVNAISLQTVQNHIPTQHNIVEGNTIVGNTNIGIDMIGASYNIIRNNNLVNNSLNRPSGSASAIDMRSTTIREVTFGSNQNIIENNKSYVDSPDSTTPAHIRISDADCVGNIVRFNKVNGGLHSEPVLDRGTDTYLYHNMFNGLMFYTGFTDGTGTRPSIYFNSDPTTGFYKVQGGDFGFSYGGQWTIRFRNGLQFNNGNDFQFGTGVGSRVGSSPLQKIGFWGVTPVVQPAGIPQTSGLTLLELEQEVNKVKFLLKGIGLTS